MAGQIVVSGATKADINKIRRRLQLLSSALAQALFKGSFPSEAALISEHGTPKEGWNYYNTSIGQTLAYHKGAWYQYTIDGENGTNSDYKGSFTVAPSDPVTDDAYYDSVDGVVYIYNGVAWEIMSQAGTGIAVTYNDSDLDATPADPTGTGETGGWHLDATEDVNWLSQKVGAGDWGTPIPAKNLVGAVGPEGPQGDPGEDGTDGTNGTDGTDGSIVPILSAVDFKSNDPTTTVSWSQGTINFGTAEIAMTGGGDSTTLKYIYWVGPSATVLSYTNTLATATATGNWLVCINDAGTAYPANATRLINAGMITVNTLAAIAVDAGTLTAGDITALTISADKMTVGTLEAGRIFSSSLAGVGAFGFLPLLTDITSLQHSSNSYQSTQTAPWLASSDQTALAVMKIQRVFSFTITGDMYCAIGEWDESGDKTDWANYDVLASDTHDLLASEDEAQVWYGNISMEAALTSGKWYMIYQESKLDSVTTSNIVARVDYNFLETKILNVDK